MEWENVPSDITPYVGFVYKITNLTNGMIYYGQKTYFSRRTKKYARKPTKVESSRLERYKTKDTRKYKKYKKELREKYKGLKKSKRVITESDWKEYTGSSKSLNEDILVIGLDNIRKEILENHTSKFDLSYREAEIQFEKRVLFDKMCYNGIINIRLCSKWIK